jgi:uncharacterized protein YjbJ (UPF0337 family)
VNKDQIQGAAKNVGGKVQEQAGKLTGNTTQQAKGLAKQVEGKAQELVGDLKAAVDSVAKR